MESSTNSVIIETGKIENTCFVVMPFDQLFETHYERVIRPAVEEIGLKCIRGDEIYSKPNIMADIWSAIRSARLVIAELTGRNPNVFYEVGLAHAIGKPVILLTRNEEDVPFDLKSLRYRYYNINDPFWGENLRNSIQAMIHNVLGATEFSTPLEGITANWAVPILPQKPSIPPNQKSKSIDVSGNWKVKFKLPDDVEHQGVIAIKQNDEDLSATMTVTTLRDEVVSIVQEELVGSIKGEIVSLEGISYTFIEQGNSDSYELESFKLKLSRDGKRMQGRFSDAGGDKGKATFVRQ
ncbi:MAG TPA: hypothetical protein VE732_04085 [Nitrososphaera sp.]|nr:hypothetical protein [Nitrososphaera sp.]